MEENYTKPDLTKEVERLMDEEGFDFGEAVKEAMANGYAAGGITGNKTYHQVRDQFMPMDSESMGYAYGGGVGSMMQPRQNYLIGGEVEENIDFSDLGLQSIVNSGLSENENMQVAGGYDSPTEGEYGFNLIELDKLKNAGYDPAELSTYPNQEDVQSIIRNLEPTARLSYDKLNNGTMTDANTSLFNQENVITPMSKPVTGITDRNRGQIIERNPSAPFNRGFTMADVAGENLPSGIMSGYTQPSADLDFQPGYDFIDAPNKTKTIEELIQNRAYNNNPYTGFIDKNIMSRGNPDASLMNKTKNAIGSGIGSIMDVMGKLPTPFNMIKGFANSRNALKKGSQNYNPALQSQVDFLNEQGMYGKNANSGLAQITGGRLAGKNLQSLFGSNDLQTMYDKDLANLEKNLEKLDTRFSKLKKSNLPAWQKKQQTILDKIAQNKAEAKAAKDKADNDAKQKSNPTGQAFNPNTTSGGSGNYRSDRDHSGPGGYGGTGRASNEARSNDLGFSDIRLKDNIELVGKSSSDINIYNFTYLNDPKVYQGVMAQEVPWASVKHDNGYLMVDYNKVDVDFKAIR